MYCSMVWFSVSSLSDASVNNNDNNKWSNLFDESESTPKRLLDQFSHFAKLMEVTDRLATLNSVYISSAYLNYCCDEA